VADQVLVALPGVGTLALTREQFDIALRAGGSLLDGSRAQGAPCTTSNEPRLLDAEQLEQRTGVPSSWWMTQARERRIPFRKIGRRVRFALEEVMACEAFKRQELALASSNTRTRN